MEHLVKMDIGAFEQSLQMARRRLSACHPLSSAESEVVASFSEPPRLTRLGEHLGLVAGPQIMLSGWGCQQRTTSLGGRQIFAIILPGDVFSTVMDDGYAPPCHFTALTDVASLPVCRLFGADVNPAANDEIRHAVMASERRAERRLFDHLERLGARDAYDRIGHLFVELHGRLAELGLTQRARFPFPIGQGRISEMVGLSEVHVNRTLQRMRTDGHLLCGPGWYALPRREELADRTGFSQIW